MKCEIEKIKLHQFFDNQLGEEENNYIGQHINKCSSCADEIEFLSELKSKFTEINELKVSDDLLECLNNIERERFSVKELIKDILKIIFKNNSGIFNIDLFTENLLREKYPARILRWVFYC